MSGFVVDVHCHTFNADDLPVKGFVLRTKLANVPLGALLSELVDALVQGGAPGYRADMARLDQLLRAASQPAGFQAGGPSFEAPGPAPPSEFDREVDVALAGLLGRQPDLVRTLGEEILADEAAGSLAGDTPADAAFSVPDVIGAARRAVHWVKLYGRSRLDLVADLVRTYDDEVDLFCPLLVDLGTGLGDVAKTTMREQVELQEKVSRAAMLGLLPGAGKARIHPFVGFDPRTELRARQAGDIETPLAFLRRAVLDYGCVGVKLYPPMGWKPWGNAGDPAVPEGGDIDGILDDLFAWCEAEQVPVVAHCNPSNYAQEKFKLFSAPDLWVQVLERHPELHLNLGHFGGGYTGGGGGWPGAIARAAGRFPHLYADVGNHKVSGIDNYLDQLAALFEGPDTATMADRLLFGTDWFMCALHKDHGSFLRQYRDRYAARFGEERAASFLGGAALRFLGFDDPDNANARRLAARHEQHAPGAEPAWLAR